MKNFKNLLVQDLQRQLYSFKFLIVVVFAIFISGVCVYINILDFNDRQQNYQAETVRTQEQMKSFRCYADFKVPVLIAPNPLAIFAKGVEDEVGNKVVIEPMELPLMEKTSEATNPFLAIFSYMDVTGIVGLVLSLLVLLITADAISGDRENHVLKMIFANSTSRIEYLISKYLSSLFVASISLFLIFVIASLLSALLLSAQLDYFFWLGVVSIFGVCLLFLSVFVLFGLLLSTRSLTGATSAMNGLFLWCVLVLLYPATVNYVVVSYTEKPSEVKLEQGITGINNDFFKSHYEYTVKNHHMRESNSIGTVGYDKIYQTFFTKFAGLTENYEFQRLEKNSKEMLPEYFASRDKVLELYNQYNNQALKPEKITHYFLCFLPNDLMRSSTTQIARTDRNFRDIQFSKAIRNYKQIIIGYLTSKDAFGMNFFTMLPIEQMKDNTYEYPEELKQQYLNNNAPRLQLNDIPEFYYPKVSVFPIEILLLLLINILLFALLYYSFMYANLT